MTTIRRLAYAVLGVALTHLVFGAIVRITGSGMGCGDHWPKCYGYWFPPMTRMDLVIEVMHRYLASVLLLALLVLVAMAFMRRREPGVGGRGGVVRPAMLALGLGIVAALLGYVTVKLGNSPPATVGHWTVAMMLIAAVTAAVIRAGGFGGTSARRGGVSAKARRGTLAAAALALAAVVLGGLTAKVEGGAVACLSFPLCGANPAVPASSVHVQGTHRVLAVLLVLHLIGLVVALRKRGEAPVIRRAASIALGLGIVQMLIAGAMIGMRLPPVLRSLHEAVGVSIWIAAFALAYLARLGSAEADGRATPAPASPSVPTVPEGDPAWSGDAVRLPTGARTALSATIRDEPRAAARTPAGSQVGVAGPDGAARRAPADNHAVGAPIVRPVVQPTAERRAPSIDPDQPAELPAALHHALRVVTASALALHGLSAAAAVRAAERDVASEAAFLTTAAAGDTAVVASAAEQAEGRASAEDAERRSLDLAVVEPATSPAPGGPPQVEGTVGTPQAADLVLVRRTIFDEAAGAAGGESDDALTMRSEPDDETDARGAARVAALDEVESLDEEFNRQFLAALALETATASVTPAARTSIAPPAAPATDVAASPLRRPSMHHSVAVIVARGADF